MHSQLALTEHVSLNLAPLILLDPVLFMAQNVTFGGSVTLKVEKVGLEAASMRPLFPLLPMPPMSPLDLGIFLTVTSALKETRGRFPSADDETPPSSVKSSSDRSESDRFTLAKGRQFHT